jgi:hypothetical protein
MLFTISSPFYSDNQGYSLYFNIDDEYTCENQLCPFYFQDLTQICNYIKTLKNRNEILCYRDKTNITINYNNIRFSLNEFLILIP